jgi:hypothetical protein
MDSVADEYNSWYGPPTQEQESQEKAQQARQPYDCGQT